MQHVYTNSQSKVNNLKGMVGNILKKLYVRLCCSFALYIHVAVLNIAFKDLKSKCILA